MKRRDVLRNLSSAAIGISAFAGISSAQESPQEEPAHVAIRSQYDTIETVKSSFKEHTQNLLNILANQDLVNTNDVSMLETFVKLDDVGGDAIKNLDENQKNSEGLIVTSTFDEKTETPTAVIRVTEEFSGGKTKIFALPEADRSYAIIKRDSGEDRLIYPNLSSGCEFSHYEYSCSSEVCNSGTDMCSPWPGVWVTCDWKHYVREQYAVYWCSADNSTYKELEYRYCSNECCSNAGEGCHCPSAGCSS